MLIKIVQNGIESDWFQLTKKAHRELIKMKPEAAIIHIEDVYPESPDAGRVIRLDFRLFTVLTREFKLEDLKQEKRDERHVEKLRLEARPANAPELASKTLDEQYIRQEIKDLLESAPALAGLTPTQLRRFQLFVESGKSFREIAEIEHCKYSTVKDSVDAAKKKIKKFFKNDRSKRDFLSDQIEGHLPLLFFEKRISDSTVHQLAEPDEGKRFGGCAKTTCTALLYKDGPIR